MKITPLEIRQKEFEKKLRGYDKDEVNAFLLSLSNEWERVLDQNKELSIKLQQAEKEVEKLRQVESSLYKTLKTAEDTGANMIEQANKAAELHMKETQMNAEAMLSESKSKARAMIEKAEMEARQIIEELQDAVKTIEQNHRDIEGHRQIAISELKNLSMTLIEKVERSSGETKEFKFDNYVKRVKELARESDDKIRAEKTEVEAVFKKIEAVQIKDEPVKKEVESPQPMPSKVEFEEKEETKFTTEEKPQSERVQQSRISEPIVEFESPKSVPEPEPISVSEPEPKKEEPKAIEKSVIEEDEVKEESLRKERKGPKIVRTVSFFDELDTEG